MRILLVDDDDLGREMLAAHLEGPLGHRVTQCSNAEEAIVCFGAEVYPLVLTDIRMPGVDGIELVKRLKITPGGRTADIVLITAHGDMHSAIAALRVGAYDYLRKPLDLNELTALVNRVVEHQQLIRDNYELTHHFEQRVEEATRETASKLKQLRNLYLEVSGIGEVGLFSEAMQKIVDMTHKFSENLSVTVLVEGETGTGKEIVARLIHENGSNRDEPFVGINCSAIPPNLFENELFGYEGGAFTGAKRTGQIGKFELAQKGTIFIDEIGDMSLEFQPKLLRVLQERNFYRVGGLKKINLDARLVCASNRNLEMLVEKGEFRQDMFYRLNVGRIFVPPLRDRKDEIVPLAQMFMRRYAARMRRHFKSIHPEALEIMLSYNWPGNIRELQNSIERIVLLHDDDQIRPEHLCIILSKGFDKAPAAVRAENSSGMINIHMPEDSLDLASIESVVIKKAIDKFAGNKTRAAKYLNISLPTLRKKFRSS